jgi:hypothetical protein
MTEEIEFWPPPARIRDLSEVPFVLREFYAESGDGFELCPEAAEYAAKCRAEIAELEKKFAAEIEAADRKSAKQEATIRRKVLERDLGGALRRHGCAARMIPAVSALIENRHTFDVEGDSAFGLIEGERVPVAKIVQEFMSTETAAVYRAPPPTSEPGPIEKAMIRIRRGGRMH